MQATSLRQGRGFSLGASRGLLSTLGDDRLVEQVRCGNSVAFEVLYDRYQAPLLSFCRHMLGSREEAEDALQQTFVSAHRDLLASRKPIKLRAWLYTIARNRSLSMLRARHEEPDGALEPSTAGLSDEVQRRDDLRELVGDLAELPEEQRTALLLAELRDLPHAEIAAVIGCEASKVKSLIYQARSGLLERREARETPCEEIREQLATLTGGALRRGPLRRHLSACPGCRAFREEVKEQRSRLAAILPVIPSAGLKQGVLAAIGIGGGTTGGGLAAGGAGIGGAAGSSDGGSVLGGALAAGGVLKLGATAIVVGTVAVGGTIVARDDDAATAGRDGGPPVQSTPGELSHDGRDQGPSRGGPSGGLGASEGGGGAGARSGDRGGSGGGGSTQLSSSGGLGDGSGGGGGTGLSSGSVGGGFGSPGGGLGYGPGGSGGNSQGSPPRAGGSGGRSKGKDKAKDKENEGNHTGQEQGQGHGQHGNGQGNGYENHDLPLAPASP